MALDSLRWRRGLAEIRARPPIRTLLVLAAKEARTFSPSTFFAARCAFEVTAKAILLIINAAILLGFLAWLLRRGPGYWIGALLVGALMITRSG